MTDSLRPPGQAGTESEVHGSGAWGKKNVLLVDSNSQNRDSRAKVMRSLGATVHCVSSAAAARTQFDSGNYNLVLVDLGRDIDGAERLAREIRGKNPQQLVAFLVGSPRFVSTSLSGKSRPPRVSPTPTSVAVLKADTPALTVDFGQKIKDAEAEQASR